MNKKLFDWVSLFYYIAWSFLFFRTILFMPIISPFALGVLFLLPILAITLYVVINEWVIQKRIKNARFQIFEERQ